MISLNPVPRSTFCNLCINKSIRYKLNRFLTGLITDLVFVPLVTNFIFNGNCENKLLILFTKSNYFV